MFPRWRLSVLAAGLVFAGCNGPEAATANNVSAASDSGGNLAAQPDNVGKQTSAPDTPRAYTLAATGLDPGLPFGMARDDAVAAATGTFGGPTAAERNEDCGEGPMELVSFGDLQLGFQEGRLAGWSLSGEAPSLRTVGGLSVGAPRSALGDIEIDEESTLGPEFDVNGVGGVLDENGARVVALWAGLPCQFR